MKCCDECLIKTCNLKGRTTTCLAYMQELKEKNLDLKINFNSNSEKRGERMKENKVYLNTVEDLTKALKDGKTIYAMDEFCAGESKLQLINNILVRKDEDGEIFTHGFKFIKDVFYLKEKPALIVEVGKFYKLVKGSKAFVYNKTSNNVYQAVEIGNVGDFEVSADGSHINNFLDYNIVDYWREDNE